MGCRSPKQQVRRPGIWLGLSWRDGNGPKDAVGKTFTLELPDGSTGKVVVQGLKSGKGGVVLALMGEDAPPF
jgi:hypothetical protein